MDLRTYLRTYGLQHIDVMDLCGVTRSAVSAWCGKRAKPSHKQIQKLIEWSKGEITYNDLMSPKTDCCPACGRLLPAKKLNKKED